MFYSDSVCVHDALVVVFFFFQAEDGIRDLVRSRGLGDVYKRQSWARASSRLVATCLSKLPARNDARRRAAKGRALTCLLYTSDAADERSSVDLGGRRIIKKKNTEDNNEIVEDSIAERGGQNRLSIGTRARNNRPPKQRGN